MVAIPGLINCHTHLATASLRCFTDDLGNTEALQALLQKEAKMDSRSAKAAASLAIAECLRFGVTSVSDLYYYPNATAEAVAESGIKANLALSSYRFIDENEDFDFETDEQCRELVKVTEKWNGFDGGRIKIDAGIYAEYISNYRLWEGLVGYAAEQNLGMQLHLAETQSEVDSCLERTGMNPGELLNCHNVFSRPTTAAGCTYLTEDERKLLGKKGVCAVATPVSAYKNGQSSTPILESVKAGMNVALGTGGAIRIDKTRIGTMDDYFQAKAGNAIGTPIAHLQPTRMPAVDLVNRPAITLLDLISRGSTKGDFEYLQILSVTRNTGIIPENTGDEATDTQKPQSTFSTALADAKVYGYADGYTVTNQLLEDDSAMASFLQNEFDYSFQLKLADMLLNGTGTNGQPKGLLNTTGVQAGNWTKADDEARNLVVAIRQSLTKLRKVGATASAILVNPEDAEKIDLMTDVNKRFMGNGPFGTGPTTVWGRPLVECDQIEAGKAIVGDFRQMALLDRSGLTVEAFNQHKDYASRNLTYVRAELRAAQVIWRPANFVVLEAK